MAYDIQVFVQAVVYFITFLLGFAVAVPLGVTVIEFGNHCILYTDFTWQNATYATYVLSHPGICNFPVFFAVFTCIFYGLAMGCYNMYAVCKTADPNIGFQMWIMPFLLINSLILILMFIICCMISVGLKSTCDSLLSGKEKGSKLATCSDGTKLDWNKQGKTNYTYSHFYSFPKASEVAAWFTFLAWVIQMAFCILRFVRNRRQRSKGMEPAAPSSETGPKDLENFASVQPSA